MDAITGITSDTASALGTLNQDSNVLGREDFLLLLVTQLTNQDPLNPMDGQEFAAQLAQFSSLEQLIGIGDTLTDNGALSGLLAQSVNSGVAAGLIGKKIEAEGADILVSDGKAAGLRYELGDAATSLAIEIKDESGKLIRTVEIGQKAKGEHLFNWDGKDADGNDVLNGNYTVNIKATDTNGNNVGTRSFMQGIVDRVTFGPEGILVWVGQTSIPMGNISSVGDAE